MSIFLTEAIISSLTGSGMVDIVSGALRALAERAKTAEQKYQTLQAEHGDPVEDRRAECIRKIAEVRNRTALCISDPELQKQIWCLLMEQTIGVYESTTKSSLDFVYMSTEQIETALNSYERSIRYRNKVSVFAVAISLFSLVGIGAFLYFAYIRHLDGNLSLPILGIPSCVLLWSVIGSFAAILYRFSNAGDRELEDPLRWLFARPLMGVVMGAITFLVIKAGLLTMTQGTSNSVSTPVSNEVTWLIAFLAGFSDRFADGLLKSLAGRFGGDKTSDLVSMRLQTGPTSSGILDGLSEFLSRARPSSKEPKIEASLNLAQNGGPKPNGAAQTEDAAKTGAK
jgi:hypothetical protein